MDFLLHERQTLIEERLKAEGRVLTVDLALELRVSDDTIRRDLREMAALGLCQRVHGGALRLSPASASIAERRTTLEDRKAVVARAAAALVLPGSTIFIDAGSTNAAIAKALSPELAVTVITNSVLVLGVLSDRSNVELIAIGGRVDQRSGASLGAKAVKDAQLIRTDICFLGACGVDAEEGVTAFSFEEAEFKRSVAAAGRSIVVAVTADKIGTAAPFSVVPGGQSYTLIVEAGFAIDTSAFERRQVAIRPAGEGRRALAKAKVTSEGDWLKGADENE